MINEAIENKKMYQPYLHEYYNIQKFEKCDTDNTVLARILNASNEALNDNHKLPRFLLIVIDDDIIRSLNVFEKTIVKDIRQAVDYLVKHINYQIRRKCLDLLAVKPGAIYVTYPTVIYVCMIRRVNINLPEGSTSAEIYNLRVKFNYALNNAVA